VYFREICDRLSFAFSVLGKLVLLLMHGVFSLVDYKCSSYIKCTKRFETN